MFAPIESILGFILQLLYDLTDVAGFGSYGAAIILLTILVKMCLYPLTVKKIQEKYKDNPQVMQQKIGALYSEAGVNPLAGCLPLLIQMPILMGMYYALFNFQYPTPEAAEFLWLPSMSEADPLHILPVLAALTTYFQTRQTSDMSNTQMKMMAYMMPLFIGFISWSFASGLVLYWVAMNCCQIVQQWWMYRGKEKPNAKKADAKKEEA